MPLAFLLYALSFPLKPLNFLGYYWNFLYLFLTVFYYINIGCRQKKHIYYSILLGFLVSLTYIDIAILQNEFKNLFPILGPFFITLLSGLSFFRILEVYPDKQLYFIYKNKKASLPISICIGLLCGLLWGFLNYSLGKNTQEVSLDVNIHCFLISLSPAIMEELAFRTTFYSFCLYIFKGSFESRASTFLVGLFMIFPHALVHTPDTFIQQGLISGLISTVFISLLFGLIFAFLQYKRDILSAMIAHGLVDIIRFCFFGLPF